MPQCPTCDRQFGSMRGLRVHHTTFHDIKLPNATCKLCGMHFHTNNKHVYCSSECRELGYSQEGENNNNFGKEKIELGECETCGVEFEYYPSDKLGLYCSDCVKNTNWREVPKPLKGEDSHWWKGGKRELTCHHCEITFTRHPSKIQSDQVFCSKDCHSAWLSRAFEGDGHPNWKGGVHQEYNRGWYRSKTDTLERDGNTCVVCGITAEEFGRNLDVHHIIPVRLFMASDDHDSADAHFPENLITLCVTCHRRADHGRIPPRVLWDAIGVDISLADDRFPDAAIDEVLQVEIAVAD